jgi:hypothetical protein
MSKWGWTTARKRYGNLGEPSMKAADQTEPQCPEDQQDKGYSGQCQKL